MRTIPVKFTLSLCQIRLPAATEWNDIWGAEENKNGAVQKSTGNSVDLSSDPRLDCRSESWIAKTCDILTWHQVCYHQVCYHQICYHLYIMIYLLHISFHHLMPSGSPCLGYDGYENEDDGIATHDLSVRETDELTAAQRSNCFNRSQKAVTVQCKLNQMVPDLVKTLSV